MAKLEQGTIGTVKFKISLAVVLALIGVALFFAFLFYPWTKEPVTYAAVLISALAVIFSAYYVATNSSITIARDKIHRSFEFTKQLNDVNYARIKTFLEKELDPQKMSADEFYAKIAANDEIASGVKFLLGIFEDASIAVQHDYVDEAALYASLSFLVPWSARTFQPYIAQQRKIAGDGAIYAELDKLAHAWKNKTSLRTNQPL